MTFVWKSVIIIILLAMVQDVQNGPVHGLNKILTSTHQFVFPDSEEDPTDEDGKNLSLTMYRAPPCARTGSTFCEEVEGYPHNYVQKILKENSTLDFLFGTDTTPDEFANRVCGDDDHFICESRQRLVFPKIGKTKGNTWQYIINQKNSPEGYVQGVQIEMCKDLNGRCRLYSNIPSGYVTSCKQKYIYRRLLSLNKEGVTANELFEMPSACCCAYKRDYSSLFR